MHSATRPEEPSSSDWKPEPDVTKSCEIELVFASVGPTETLVEPEHMHFERHERTFRQTRDMVDSERGWSKLLQVFSQKVTSTGGCLARFEEL
jgi:ATP sulfurylase